MRLLGRVKSGSWRLLLLLGPALLAAGCATGDGSATPEPRPNFTPQPTMVKPGVGPKDETGSSRPISPSGMADIATTDAPPNRDRSSEILPKSATSPTIAIPPSGDFSVAIANVAAELTAPRSEYDIGIELTALIKPHFWGRAAGGALTEISAATVASEADAQVVEWQGKAALQLTQDGAKIYVDLLALQSELLGEHPVHKLYRMRAMGVPFSNDLRQKLRYAAGAVELFNNVEFEYLRGQDTAGVVVEVFPDGTLLVLPFALPKEWQSKDPRIVSPTHLHVNPRGLNVGGSALAQEYEREILALPFPEQRYPTAPLAKKQCQVYQESVAHSGYVNLMTALGFQFAPDHLANDFTEIELSFGERMQGLIWGGFGDDRRYFGFESEWIGDLLRREGADWLGECDTAGGIHRYPGADDSAEIHYLVVRRSLEPDKTQRYKILALDRAGVAWEIYSAPGIILMAQPLPFDRQTWLLSAEGWAEEKGDQPADPRWQTVYLAHLDNPKGYEKVKYPIQQFTNAPVGGLYGASAQLTAAEDYLLNTLYGFRDEGGGIWIADVSQADFHTNGDNFKRIVAWDHPLSWTILPGPAEDTDSYHVFMTGKEVADDFAMTANILRIRNAGLESRVEREERLLQMVGWNPVPVGWQRLSATDYRLMVETHYNYESSLLPRAKGVYLIPVNLSEGKRGSN